ncbi:MAG: class II D-tagatose-bisphosphate aldolase, non-catalytic subunit [Treponema sp.]|nr:class II D-tagatose-bisphosphate aldolase, non-catalytic subunit [Treponema sp.]
MKENLLKELITKNRSGQRAGLYSVCSANELVLRSSIRHAVIHDYPLIIESTSNQVNQFGGYTGMRPHEFMAQVKKIAREENMDEKKLILGGDHLGPLLWQNEPEKDAMEKAVDMVKAYATAGFGKIHLDTSMKLAHDPDGPLDVRVCARRGAELAKAVYENYARRQGQINTSNPNSFTTERPVLVIGSEVPIPGGSREHEDSVTPTDAGDFLKQVSIYKEEFEKAGIGFDDVIAFVVQPGVEFGDDFVYFYDPEKAAPLAAALKTVGGLVFEGHSTDYQSPNKLARLVSDGIAILKVGPALTFALREGLFLLEAIEEILVPAASRSNVKRTLLEEMNSSKKYWEKYYSGTSGEVEYKKLYSYSDRCRYYLPADRVQNAINVLFKNIPHIPPALLSEFFPQQYRRYMEKQLRNDPVSVLCDRIGDVCADYAAACGFI